MGLVLWIDKNTFASSFVEKVFKKKGLDFYSISSGNDFSYLVEDLKPSIIVLDAETARADLEAFKGQYNSSIVFQSTPAVVIGQWDGLDFIKNKKGVLSRSFDPFTIPEILANFLD